MNLILYGPPGSGKTTVGQMAAHRLGREFLDFDDYIERRWGRPVPDYFVKGDEHLFRQREAETCRVVAARDDLVAAPGGGALLNPRNRAALEGTGTLVGLSAPLETLAARLEGSYSRPLLASDLRIGTSGDFKIGLNEVSIQLTLPVFATELARDRLSKRGCRCSWAFRART